MLKATGQQMRMLSVSALTMGTLVCSAAANGPAAANGQAAANGPAVASGAAPAKMEFDVVSVKVNKSEDGRMMIGGPPGAYSAKNTMLWLLIKDAYQLQTKEMLSGLPSWAESAHFDIEAKVDPEVAEAMKKLAPKERQEQRRLMLQALLADRFGLQVHHVSRELPAYAMVVAKGGFKLKEADPDHPTVEGLKGPDGMSKPGMMMMGLGTLTAQAIPLSNLAQNLSGWVQRQIVDRTGLTGKYDVSLKWTPDEMQGGGGGPAADGSAAPSGPSLMTALEEQLGLKLEAIKLASDTIVVDHVQMPSEN